MTFDHKTYTIYDANNPGSDWLNLYLSVPSVKGKNLASNLAAWGNSAGNITLTYTKPANRSIASMGAAGLLLYCTPITARASISTSTTRTTPVIPAIRTVVAARRRPSPARRGSRLWPAA